MLFNNHIYLWLVLAGAFALFEIGSPGLFYSFSLAGGALVAAGCAYMEYSAYFQCVAFLLGACFWLLILTRFVKRMNQTGHAFDTNVFALKGKKAVVTKVASDKGVMQVRLDGQVWSARSTHDEAFQVGMHVVVERVVGVTLIVKPDVSHHRKDRT